MTKSQVIERFCNLSSNVANEVFGNKHASDCFCDKNRIRDSSYQFEEAVIDFIENAVNEKIASGKVK